MKRMMWIPLSLVSISSLRSWVAMNDSSDPRDPMGRMNFIEMETIATIIWKLPGESIKTPGF